MSSDPYRWTTLICSDASRGVAGASHEQCLMAAACACACHRSRTEARKILDAHTAEDDLLDKTIRYARLRHWRVHHDRPARTRDGWRTAIQGDKGFPDLLMVRGRRIVVAELKDEDGEPTPEQEVWLAALGEVAWPSTHVSVLRTYVWRPSSWPEIEEILR